MVVKRDIYLNKLISKRHNGLIKVITGVRRCGKSYLLFHLFKEHLLSKDVDVYVTGSNARFLSKDVIAEFRGRGDEIHMFPLSFSEFMSVYRQS